jgi:hypothetical protein
MATSGTTAFTLDIINIIEEAYEIVGTEMRSGYDIKTARRSLDMLMREWGNRGVNFWTIRQTSTAVAAGTTQVTLAADTIDVLDAVWRTGSGTSQYDRTLTRMSVVDWAQTANKNTEALPTQFWINRLQPQQVLHLWPVPSSAGTLVYWGLRSIQDAGAYGNTMDVPVRFLPALTNGLAYYLAIKVGVPFDRLTFLKAEYDRQFQLASEEDRERAPFKLVPNIRC